MIESEDGTVTGSIDRARLDAVEPKTDEARAQLEQLRGEVTAGQEQADADAERLAAQSRAQAFLARDDDGVERVQQPDTDTTADEGTTSEAVTTTEAQPGSEEQDVDALRAEAEGLGVQVDRRWGANRLRQEIDTARQQG